MKVNIDSTEFGSISIEGNTYEYDVIIQLDRKVKKRKKKLSKLVYGTSHIVSLDEAKHIYEKGAKKLIIGSGQSGLVTLCDEASEYFKRKKCKVKLSSTQKAIDIWNKEKDVAIGLFHVTC